MVILGIADPHHVVRGKLQQLQRRGEPARLVDAGGQHHYRALVEDDLQFELQLADGLQHRLLLRFPGGDNAAAHRERRNAPSLQGGDEICRGRVRDRPLLARLRQVEQGAIFHYGDIEQVEPIEGALQVRQFPAGDEDQLAAALPHLLQRGNGGPGDVAMVGDGSVIVGGQCLQVHARLAKTSGFRSTRAGAVSCFRSCRGRAASSGKRRRKYSDRASGRSG